MYLENNLTASNDFLPIEVETETSMNTLTWS